MLPSAPGQCSQPPPGEKSPPAEPKMDLKRRQFQAEAEQRQHFMFSDYYALLRIFQYLKVNDLLRAARVCRMWSDLAVHPSLWRTVRMKDRCEVTDWDGFAEALKRHGTQHLDMRRMWIAVKPYFLYYEFAFAIPRVTSLVKLELCRCSVVIVEQVIRNCPQLEVLSAMSITSGSLNLESVGNLKRCQKLKLRSEFWISLKGDLSPLQTLTQLTHLSVMGVYELGLKRIDILESLSNLETLELEECSQFPEEFGTRVLLKLHNLRRLRLEGLQSSCCTFNILEGVSKLENLSQLELVNFNVTNGFDKCLAKCKNIKRLLIIPSYIFGVPMMNDMVLGGVTELSNNLTHFVWGFTLMIFKETKTFINQQMNEHVTGDFILISKPLPCLKLNEDIKEDDSLKGDIMGMAIQCISLHRLQKLFNTVMPKTRVKLWKIPSYATWERAMRDD